VRKRKFYPVIEAQRIPFPGFIVPYTIDDAYINEILEVLPDYGDMAVIVFDEEEYPDCGVLAHVHPPLVKRMNEKMIFEGMERVRIVGWREKDTVMLAKVETIETPEEEFGVEEEALLRSVKRAFERYLSIEPDIAGEIIDVFREIKKPEGVLNFIGTYSPLPVEVKENLLRIPSLIERLRYLREALEREMHILILQKKIDKKVKEEMARTQRQYYLSEQLKVIKRELGKEDDEILELENKIEQSGMPDDVRRKALRELEKLKKAPPISPEATVIRNYLDWLVSLPWNTYTKDNLDITHAKRILDEDHYGLKDIKERILEYLSVIKLSGKVTGQIICFVGPPGVGKTSLARSIARALGRKFVRVSLGGIKDEAEIRGHRRTYVGALPGKIIQRIRDAGTKNPVFLLDEIDKIGKDFRGDPAAALLEALDPEVNHSFHDHYLEVPFDLSSVLFITTANVTHTIPPALLDRMEVIELPGYLEPEKQKIAKYFLVPKVLKRCGLDRKEVKINDGAIRKIIRNYTKEAGVRNLEREIEKVARKIAKRIAEGEKRAYRITAKNVEDYLGPPRFFPDKIPKGKRIGIATGLAVTEAGGETIQVEVEVMEGNGNLILTGQLGDVMKESAQAALSYLRANCHELGLPPDFYKKKDIHIHVPEGAVPKDGPSAGITIMLAILSALKKKPTSPGIAMTGEITLRGDVLPVGGLKEKIVAAKTVGIKRVIIPWENERQIKELPEEAKEGLEIIPVRRVEEVIRIAFEE